MIPQASEDDTVLRLAEVAPRITIDALAPGGGVLIVSPHPDDETFGCGMALAAAAAEGRMIAIVLLTDGEGSHPNSRQYGPERLVALRRAEFEKALATLAPRVEIPVLRLGLPDGRTNLSVISEDEIEQIEAFARREGLSSIWSTWIGDPHCDHETAALLSAKLAERLDVPLFSFPVWGRFGPRAVPTDVFRFISARFVEAKRCAIAAYASQTTGLIDDDPGGFRMPQEMVAHFAAHPEVFIRER